MYGELMSFVQEFGHAKVPFRFPANPSLGYWVKRQRFNYKKFLKDDLSSDMTIGRIQLLNKVGFEWKSQNSQPWDIRYKELVSFVEVFGHTKVPQHFPPKPSLGHWVDRQRQSYKKFLKGNSSSNMTDDRIQLLNKIGFEWVVNGTLEYSF